ncbi:unnamed protein product [Arabidopsis halleri]
MFGSFPMTHLTCHRNPGPLKSPTTGSTRVSSRT